MAEEISYHTENLEQLVEERTRNSRAPTTRSRRSTTSCASENVRLGAELDVARQIQMMVLPKARELGADPGVEIAAYMGPADEVGGDYYDVLQDGARVKIGIGDVTGHGLESGVLMLMVQSVARALQETGEGDPRQFLDRLNRAIYKNIERTKSDKHLSLAFLDYEDERVTLSGQHEEVLVVRARRRGRADRHDRSRLPDRPGAATSRRSSRRATSFRQRRHHGPAHRWRDRGGRSGRRTVRPRPACESARQRHGGSAEEIKDGIIDDLMAHIGTQKIHDDITLVVMRHR